MSATLDEGAAWALVRAALAPATRGAGPRRLRVDPGGPWLDVEPSGRWESSAPVTGAARDLIDLYLPLALQPDLVIGQLGQSLDGRIATESGDSHFITGPADIRRLHRVRALVDAVIVGAGTVERDDPRLTVREVEGESPVRVVLDPDARLSPERLVFTDGAARTLVVRRAPPESARSGSSAPAGAGRGAAADVEVVTLPFVGPAGFDPATVLEALRARGLRRVLVEGGGITVSRFLQAGTLDRLHVTVAPVLLGSGRPALTLPPLDALARAIRPRCRHVHLGEDLLFDLELR